MSERWRLNTPSIDATFYAPEYRRLPLREDWNAGDKVWAAGEAAEVLEHDAKEAMYRVKLLTSNRELWMDAKLVFAKNPTATTK